MLCHCDSTKLKIGTSIMAYYSQILRMRNTMIDKIEILHDLKNHLYSKFGKEIKKVILFGSQASNTASIGSDYDFIIILRTKPDWKLKRQISDLCYDIDLKYNIITDTHLLAESELNSLRGKQPIYRNAINKGIHA